jgi:hypothetical protein
MTQTTWSFSKFAEWLRARVDLLREAGSVAELEIQRAPRASVRCRVERGTRLGELTVWDDGSAHMAVVDLASGEFVFERDGVSVAGGSSEHGLAEFFAYLAGSDA